MTTPNNNHNVIVYRHPYRIAARRARRGYRIPNFNDRSPDYRAMKAHLRASAYKNERESDPLLP